MQEENRAPASYPRGPLDRRPPLWPSCGRPSRTLNLSRFSILENLSQKQGELWQKSKRQASQAGDGVQSTHKRHGGIRTNITRAACRSPLRSCPAPKCSSLRLIPQALPHTLPRPSPPPSNPPTSAKPLLRGRKWTLKEDVLVAFSQFAIVVSMNGASLLISLIRVRERKPSRRSFLKGPKVD